MDSRWATFRCVVLPKMLEIFSKFEFYNVLARNKELIQMTSLTETSPEVQLYAAFMEISITTAIEDLQDKSKLDFWAEVFPNIARLVSRAEKLAKSEALELALDAVLSIREVETGSYPHNNTSNHYTAIRALITQEQGK